MVDRAPFLLFYFISYILNLIAMTMHLWKILAGQSFLFTSHPILIFGRMERYRCHVSLTPSIIYMNPNSCRSQNGNPRKLMMKKQAGKLHIYIYIFHWLTKTYIFTSVHGCTRPQKYDCWLALKNFNTK